MSKKSGYKYQVEQALLKNKWEIKTIGSNEDWWDDEHWKIYYKDELNICLYLCFIVDPMFKGERKSGQGVYEILASTEFPSNWNDDSNRIASIRMTKRKFEIKLEEFIKDLERYKMEKTTTNAV
ncbi:hypothetical protein L3X39_06360 [Sabulilitoribacter multivorans]|uniref:Immunity protein 53 n=1 Tax=Flaviramulus multivorans TaxID=1304750 RepID=A0ABS9IJ00_9FLAO|nr:hypothetical protein [Flaviramulus multivorans]MCF7560257.1 hypothetical protein [Flaviramulus multivorans]